MVQGRRRFIWGLLLLGGISCRSAEDFSAEEKAAFAGYVQALSQGRESIDVRDAWYARGQRETKLALDYLYMVLITSAQPVDPESSRAPWDVAREEMVYIGYESVPFLVEAARFHASEKPIDWMILDRIAWVLGDLDATEELTALLGEASDDLRYFACQGLGRISGSGGTAALGEILAGDASWKVRAQAVDGLALRVRESSGVVDLLVLALMDPDPFVVRKAGAGLATVRTDQVRLGLVGAYRRAYEARELELARTLYDALEQNTRQFGVSSSPEAWEEVVAACRGELEEPGSRRPVEGPSR